MYKNIWRLSTLSISHSGGCNNWSIINIFIKLPGKVLQLSYFCYFFTQIPTIHRILWGLSGTLHCVQVDRVWLQVPEQSPGGAGGHQQPALPPDQHLLAAVRCVLNYRFWPWMEGIKYTFGTGKWSDVKSTFLGDAADPVDTEEDLWTTWGKN